MKPVTVARYDGDGLDVREPDGTVAETWLGWVGTDDWIVWENAKGELYVYNGREPSGGVKGAPTIVQPTA